MTLGNDRAGARPRRVTIVDVAQHAGVSVAAASKVLRSAYGVSDDMRLRVQTSMAALNYRPSRPARGMRGRTYTVGMVVGDIENPFTGLLAKGAATVLERARFDLLIAQGGSPSSKRTSVVDALIDHQMDGLILVAPRLKPAELDRIASELPCVIVGRESLSPTLDSVAGDDVAGSRLVVDHLVALGHRRIAFISHSVPGVRGLPEDVRARGFQQAMDAYDLLDQAVMIDGEWTQRGGEEAARHILELDSPPTAIHAGADVAAIGLLSALIEQGVRVPENVSVAGSDNSPTSALAPISLTTVDQSGSRMGELAAEVLLERIEGRPDVRHELITPRLIVRSTTGLRP